MALVKYVNHENQFQTNKKLIVTHLCFSLLSLLFIITLTVLISLKHNYLNLSNHHTHLNDFFYLNIVFIVLLITSYLIDFIIAFYIKTKNYQFLWSIKITAWIFLLSSLSWIFDLWYLKIYAKESDKGLKQNLNTLNNNLKISLLITFLFSLIAITLLCIGIVGQLTWNKNGHQNLFLPCAFFSMLSWSICVMSIIQTAIMFKWKSQPHLGVDILFLLVLPIPTSLILFAKKSYHFI